MLIVISAVFLWILASKAAYSQLDSYNVYEDPTEHANITPKPCLAAQLDDPHLSDNVMGPKSYTIYDPSAPPIQPCQITTPKKFRIYIDSSAPPVQPCEITTSNKFRIFMGPSAGGGKKDLPCIVPENNAILLPGPAVPPGLNGHWYYQDRILVAPGPEGPPGLQGLPGLPEPKGDYDTPRLPRLDGNHGLEGQHGEKGEPGAPGLKGEQGPKGFSGRDGIPGVPGPIGPAGPPGPPGLPAVEPQQLPDRYKALIKDYITEIAGILVGPPGPKGSRGLTGIRGEKGMRGERGEYGYNGLPGIKGDRGHDGIGIPGPPGPEGKKWYQGTDDEYDDVDCEYE